MADIHAGRYWPLEHRVGGARCNRGNTTHANFPVSLLVDSSQKQVAANFRHRDGVVIQPILWAREYLRFTCHVQILSLLSYVQGGHGITLH